MPTFAPNVEPFVIRPPTTTRDKGTPTADILRDAQRVFALIDDERHLTAQKLWHDVQRRLQEWDESSKAQDAKREILKQQQPLNASNRGSLFRRSSSRSGANSKEDPAKSGVDDNAYKKTKELLQSRSAVLEKLENRCRLFKKAQENNYDNGDWIFASNHFGVKTYYRRETNGSLTIKLEGDITDLSLFEQICVVKEVDLHHIWVPFCASSLTIADLDKIDGVGWFITGLPQFGLARDGCFRSIGCDNMSEDGTVIVYAQGIQDRKPGAEPPEDTFLEDDPIISQLNIPPVPTRMGCARMSIRKFEAVFKILGPTACSTHMIANIDPNIAFLPQSLIDFCMKHLAGVILAKLQGAAKKIIKNPTTNPHARRMRLEKEFYQGWLMQKFEAVCEEKGWIMPSVPAFEVTDEEIAQALHHEKSAYRSNSFPAQDGVVQNIDMASMHSSPAAVKISDDMSELSSRSGRSWRNNPISAYLREVELKTQQRKADAIREAREKTLARLKPKELDPADEARLQELRAARARRQPIQQAAARALPRSQTATEKPASFSQRLTEILNSQGDRARFFIVSALLVVLFSMLHPELLLNLLPLRFDPEKSWWLVIGFVGITIFYTNLVAIPFLLLCDTALVFAFDSIELLSKSGREVRRFYSDFVRYVLVVGSFGIVGVSFATAFVKLFTRVLILGSYNGGSLLFSLLRSATQFASAMVPTPIITAVENASSATSSTLSIAIAILSRTWSWVVVAPASLLLAALVRSNFVGRGLESAFMKIVGAVSDSYNLMRMFVENSIDSFEGKTALISQCNEAFQTSRLLFSYISTLLVIALVLFTLIAKSARLSPAEVAAKLQQSRSIPAVNRAKEVGKEPKNRTYYPSATIPEEKEVAQGLDPQASSNDISETASLRRSRLRRLFRGDRQGSQLAPEKTPRVGRIRTTASM